MSGSFLDPATTYTQVLFLAPLAVVKVVLNIPLVSRYVDDPHSLRYLLAATTLPMDCLYMAGVMLLPVSQYRFSSSPPTL